jgi:sphinganine-1-phosphate aldolase
MDSFSYSSMKSMLIQARGSLNSRLSEFEPLVLLLVPLVSLFLAQIIGSVFGVVHEKGLKACLIGFIMGLLK